MGLIKEIKWDSWYYTKLPLGNSIIYNYRPAGECINVHNAGLVHDDVGVLLLQSFTYFKFRLLRTKKKESGLTSNSEREATQALCTPCPVQLHSLNTYYDL